MTRTAILAAASIALAACGGERRAEPARLESQPSARALTVHRVGAETGDAPLVVLMHGWGAPGDDLVALGRILHQRAGVRVLLPEAPLERPPTGRAWWPIDPEGLRRPSDRGGETPAGMAEARRDVIALLDAERARGGLTPSRTVLAGFSQGAMLAADVALEWEHRPAGLVMMSGGPVDEARWRARMERAPPRVFQSHGRRDALLRFDAAERLRQHFEGAGADVTFVEFDGGHTIPDGVLERLVGFLRGLS